MIDPDEDIFANYDTDDEEFNLAMIPPIENANALSDQDSDASDDMHEGLTFTRSIIELWIQFNFNQ